MNSDQRQQFKAKAHALKPVVMIGDKGLTETVTAEVDQALDSHELIKIKIRGQEKADRQQLATDLCAKLQAELIQHIGNTLVLYRKKVD